MIWVYCTVATGAAVLLVWIIIDYFNAASILRPMVSESDSNAEQSEEDIIAEQGTTALIEQDISELKEEITRLEKDTNRIESSIEELNKREQRRTPTKQRLD